jgi:hypothetical protein
MDQGRRNSIDAHLLFGSHEGSISFLLSFERDTTGILAFSGGCLFLLSLDWNRLSS